MIFGCGITELTGIISRRTVYYSRHAAGDHSVIRFEDDDGNLPFVRAEHDFNDGRCRICGAPEDLERGAARENYAYAFIHGAYPTEEMREMKFDVIVGNPPYQIDDVGGHRPVPIYQRFVTQARQANPRYIVMITPSRWMTGGLGLTAFRSEMLADRRLRSLVDHTVASEVFPGVDVHGGVSYFLWDRDYAGPCEYTVHRGSTMVGPVDRALDEHDIFVRDSKALPLLRRVTSSDEESFSDLVASVRPFGDRLRSNFRDVRVNQIAASDRRILYASTSGRKVAWVDDALVTNNRELADGWKIFLPTAYGERGSGAFNILGPGVIGPPRSVCTETYLAIGPFDNELAARNAGAYLQTRFARFMVSLRKHGQHNIPSTFTWVPQLDWDKVWTDTELFERFSVSTDEAAHIEDRIREMSGVEIAGLEDYA
jgi:site-specific DNA-methyltransferase (adenine-specific)